MVIFSVNCLFFASLENFWRVRKGKQGKIYLRGRCQTFFNRSGKSGAENAKEKRQLTTADCGLG